MGNFGDIRSILHSPPGQNTWNELCGALDPYEGREPLLEVALPYCLRALGGWPPEIEREPPETWVQELIRGEPPAALSLCSHLHCWVDFDEGIELAHKVASLPHFSRLRVLRLGADIGEEGAAALAASPHLQGLLFLDLNYNVLEDEGVRAIAESPFLTKLGALHLAGTGVGDEGAIALASSPNLAHLTFLDLAENDIGDEGAIALASSPHLGQLEQLALEDNVFGERGALALATSPHLCEQIKAEWR